MRCDILLLAALPSALASVFAYKPSAAALARAKTDAACELPAKYAVKNFVGKTSDANSTNGTLSSYQFTYTDLTTNLTTACQHSSSSAPANNGTTPRYSCANQNVQYIWEDDEHLLWMIERICHGANGKPSYEVSGSTGISLTCSTATGDCRTNTTSYTSPFTGLDPMQT